MNAQRAMKRQALKKMDSLPAPRLRPYHSSRTAHHQRPPQKIIANGSVLHSQRSADKNAPDDHIEVVAIATRVIRTGPAQFTSFSTSNTDAGDEEKHYAILIRRAGSQVSMKMILKGEAKDLVVEALEWMTAKAEQMIHGWSGKTAKDDQECALMWMGLAVISSRLHALLDSAHPWTQLQHCSFGLG